MPCPASETIIRTGKPSPAARTDNLMMSPSPVCRTAFSSSASIASPSRSLSACAVTLSSRPSCQRRLAVGRHRRRISIVKLSSATGSSCRNSGSSAAAMTSSRSAIRPSRFSSPRTTWMSSPSCRPVSSRASSSACPSAIVIGVRSWCEASWRNRRWLASSRALSSLTRVISCSEASLRRVCQIIAPKMAAISGTSVGSAP